ncbi:YgaP family membrane protein [Flavobacterium sp.]|uniref:YgaP family membrane protein n=1 Tax=Flavobacterium sp. TaxID=239 RepID=UPI003D26CA5A
MVNKLITRIAGIFIIISVLLGMYVNPNFYWFTLFVGANLLQSSYTNWCLMGDILRKVFKVKD